MGTTRRAMRVLFATDGSEAADAAARWLAVFPLPANARVLVLAVQELPPSPIDIPTVRDFQRALLAEARHTAGRAAATLRERFGTIETRVVAGDPRERIIDVAAEWDADLIVVGARGLGAVATALLGSVSLAVARHAPCPVLVVRPVVRPLHSIVVAFDGSRGAHHARDLLVGAPADTLARLDADLIVLGARGIDTLKRLLVGSVSEHVLRHAHCPVLIVRGSLLERVARRRRRRARSSASS
jgi:nucleotide-binding universal stress UspA family protein